MDASKQRELLERLKKEVRNTHINFKPNYDRFNEFQRFVFESSLTPDQVSLLQGIGMPQLEFNICEPYISRLLGEFYKQEPDIEVSARDQDRIDPITIKVVEQHLKHLFSDSNNKHTGYQLYRDVLSGGFGVAEIYTDYEHEMSTKQVIRYRRLEPTLCGFDQNARDSHKGDGRFCFQLFPKEKEEFEKENPHLDLKGISYGKSNSGFNWSYNGDNTKIVLVCNYYDKQKKEETIVEVRDRGVMTQKKYHEMLDTWNDITAPPGTIGKSRKTMLNKIVRYQFIENRLIAKPEETDFRLLPMVFYDGNSVLVKTIANGNIRQVTRPYVYNAKGIQRLHNFAGMSLANEIENTVQHKFMVAKEALPKEEDFLEAYKDVQKASVMVFNAFLENNPEHPILNPIREIQRVPCPPEIIQAFQGSSSLMQNIMGTYDASLGINNNQLSGVAIVEAATQSNPTAMPYVIGYLQGEQRIAEIYVDLMPKYMTTPQTLPVVDERGMRHFVKINQQDGVPMDFDPFVLNVELKAGASFQVQKSRTIMMVKEMMGMSPLFAQFVAEKGIHFILDNMEGKGIDELKGLVDEWMKEYQQQKEQAMKQQQQDPAAIKAQVDMAKVQQQQQKNQQEYTLGMAKLQQNQQKMETDLHLGKQSSNVQIMKALTEKFAKQMDLKIKQQDMHHRHAKERIETHHKIKSQKQENRA